VRVALVTGGAVRLGKAIALDLARGGCEIALHYNSSHREAARTARQIEELGVRCRLFRADLSGPAHPERLIRQVISQMGRLDYLIGSAASFIRRPFSRTDANTWDSAMNLNARANFLLGRAAASELKKRRGRIVILSDLAAHRIWREYSAHSISKAATEAVVRALARALAPEVSVNGIAPGTILPPKSMPRAAVRKLIAKIPLGRSGTPEEIAQTVRFLCEGPALLTGQILIVDGGRSLF
jgi:pteridine reductase